MEHILPRRDLRRSPEKRFLLGLGGGAMLFLGIKSRSFLGGVLSIAGADFITQGITGHHLYEAAGITTFTKRGRRSSIPYQLGVQVQRSITVSVEPDEAYQYIRNPENLPLFLSHVKSVTPQDRTHTHWVLRGIAGTEIEFDSELVNDTPGNAIAWRSINCPYFESAGSIRFDQGPQNRGTTMRFILQYIPPGGALSTIVWKLFGKDPEEMVKNDLRRLKELLEAGEIATTHGQPSGAYPLPTGRESEEVEPIGFRPLQRAEQRRAASAQAS